MIKDLAALLAQSIELTVYDKTPENLTEAAVRKAAARPWIWQKPFRYRLLMKETY